MSKTYFISDAHLGLGNNEEERRKENRLLSFLKHISKDADRLYIVGDLFDTWIEYRTVIPKGFHRLFAQLDGMSSLGIQIYFLTGNHDYWIRDFFSKELKIKTFIKPFETVIDGKRIFLHHGDGLSNKDVGYSVLKQILRNRFCIWLYSWLHPDFGISLARFASRTSREYTGQKHFGEEDGMIKTAETLISQGYDIVIMGHRHKPIIKEIGKGFYVNLGDWISHNTYAEFENGKIKINEWKSE